MKRSFCGLQTVGMQDESDLDTLNETLERLNNGKVRWEQSI